MKTSCRGRSLIIHKKIFPIVRNKANNSTAAHPAPGLLPRPSRERDIKEAVLRTMHPSFIKPSWVS